MFNLPKCIAKKMGKTISSKQINKMREEKARDNTKKVRNA